MTAETTVNQIIQSALTTAATKSEAAQAFGKEAISAIDEAGFELSSPPVFSGGPAIPRFEGDLRNDPSLTFKSDLAADAGALTAQLSNIFGNFLNTYFPRSTAALAAAEQWLENAISVGGTGIKAGVENQIWERARARELKEANRLEYEATSAFAARGFSLPPGALAGRLLEVQQEAQNKISAHSRDVAIEQAKMEVENVRFAIDHALRHRLNAINGALEYWKAYLLPEDIAARKAIATAEIKNKFYHTALEYYNSQISLYGQRVRESGIFFDAANQAYMAQAQAKVGLGSAKAQAASAAANAAGQIASAAMAAINTLSQYGYAEQKTL